MYAGACSGTPWWSFITFTTFRVPFVEVGVHFLRIHPVVMADDKLHALSLAIPSDAVACIYFIVPSRVVAFGFPSVGSRRNFISWPIIEADGSPVSKGGRYSQIMTRLNSCFKKWILSVNMITWYMIIILKNVDNTFEGNAYMRYY